MTGLLTSGPRAFAADQRLYGVVIGVVTDNDDPDGQGRVRVSFPWLDGGAETHWARLVQPYAGAGFGHYFVPEIDSEVLIGFLQGDLRFPYVLGGLYNGVDLPPFTRGDRDPKVIQTKAGHRILMEDKDGQQYIEIIDASGANSVRIDTAENKITITASGDIGIEAGGKLTMSGSAGIDITSPAAVTVAGSTIALN